VGKQFNKTARINHGCNGKGVRAYNEWEKERYNNLKTKYTDKIKEKLNLRKEAPYGYQYGIALAEKWDYILLIKR
jgi:hypothetical protein